MGSLERMGRRPWEERGHTQERAAAEVKEMDKGRRRWIHFLYERDSVGPIFFDPVHTVRKTASCSCGTRS
jgi:hypothetical protein